MLDQIASIDKRNDFYAGRQNTLIQLLHFCMKPFERRFSVRAFAHRHPGRNDIRIVYNPSVFTANRPGKLAKPDLCSLRNDGDILHSKRCAALCIRTVFSMSCTLPTSPSSRTLICCSPGFDEAAAGIDVVASNLLFHLSETEPIGDQLVRDRRAPGTRASARRSWQHPQCRGRTSDASRPPSPRSTSIP